MLDDVKRFQAQMVRDQSSFNLQDQLTLGGYCGEEEQDTDGGKVDILKARLLHCCSGHPENHLELWSFYYHRIIYRNVFSQSPLI